MSTPAAAVLFIDSVALPAVSESMPSTPPASTTSSASSASSAGPTPEAALQHPGLFRRGIALSVDMMFVVCLFQFVGRGLVARLDAYLLSLPIYDPEGRVLAQTLADLGVLHALLGPAVVLGYFALCEGFFFRATLGKLFTGISIASSGGRPCSLVRATLRNGFKVLTIATLGLGMVPALFSSRSRSLHDLCSGTMPVLYR